MQLASLRERHAQVHDNERYRSAIRMDTSNQCGLRQVVQFGNT